MTLYHPEIVRAAINLLDMVREGYPASLEAITYALKVTGDIA